MCRRRVWFIIRFFYRRFVTGVVHIWDSFRDRNTYFKDMLIFFNNYLWLCILTFQMKIENSATNLRVRNQLTLIQIELRIKFSLQSYLWKEVQKNCDISGQETSSRSYIPFGAGTPAGADGGADGTNGRRWAEGQVQDKKTWTVQCGVDRANKR